MGCYVLSQEWQATASSRESLSGLHVVLGVRVGKGKGECVN